jgi:hypothetical protein
MSKSFLHSVHFVPESSIRVLVSNILFPSSYKCFCSGGISDGWVRFRKTSRAEPSIPVITNVCMSENLLIFTSANRGLPTDALGGYSNRQKNISGTLSWLSCNILQFFVDIKCCKAIWLPAVNAHHDRGPRQCRTTALTVQQWRDIRVSSVESDHKRKSANMSHSVVEMLLQCHCR